MRTEKTRKSGRQEERIAALLGGRVVPRSGAGPTHKGDVISDVFLVECKRTDNVKSISVQVADQQKIEMEAALIGRFPAMAIEIGGKDYFVVPDWVLMEI